MNVTLFWFRRDLRLEDNTALQAALENNPHVLPLFIFDENILQQLPEDDSRVNFIHHTLQKIDQRLKEHHSSLLIKKGKPEDVWKALITNYTIKNVYINKDYEPYALKRDQQIEQLLEKNNITLHRFKDQVIHEESEVMKADGTPYTVFTPYKNRWLEAYRPKQILPDINFQKFYQAQYDFPTIKEIGFSPSKILVKPYNLSDIHQYANNRNYPGLEATSYLSPHLRFGTVSIREIMSTLTNRDDVFLSELIWREFFMQILFHFPKVTTENFRAKYDGIQWLNNETDFEKWCKGQTGYPLVDAGMRELNESGYMHNRVRMVTASFLCKHLLIDWRWGEAYFAQKLLDYELSSNNGNWQWAAGTGCDAAPYFRIFNPIEQLKKFDSSEVYVKKWVSEYGTTAYPSPMVDHSFARARALDVYKAGIDQ